MNQPDEASLRAAVIVGILRYTKIAIDDDAGQIRMCSVGEPFSEAKLKQVSTSLRVQGNTLDFAVIANSNVSNQRLATCDVLIVGEDFSGKKSTLNQYSGLSICDGCNEHNSDYVVELIKVDKRIGFNVNLILAEKRNVTFSSSLLELASKIVRPEK
ncbi:YfiR family protein [Catenovulum agarivorans]|uniref:YfiR family protein n=1 Tax=Catenovulum agarivorans TaxID=1172192 RepID=UPI0002F0A74E|nr:YfiR family protein [Catenovulum agarivorans]